MTKNQNKLSPELPGGQEVVGPLLHVLDADVEPGGDDAALVEPPGQVDDDLAAAVVVHHLELADVAVLHHHGQEPWREFDENLQNKTFSRLIPT